MVGVWMKEDVTSHYHVTVLLLAGEHSEGRKNSNSGPSVIHFFAKQKEKAFRSCRACAKNPNLSTLLQKVEKEAQSSRTYGYSSKLRPRLGQES
jgi:hypothetical protein